MSYTLHCITCGRDISPMQYDTHLGLCPECAEEAEDLDEFDDDGQPESGSRRNITRQPYETWPEAKRRATRTPTGREAGYMLGDITDAGC